MTAEHYVSPPLEVTIERAYCDRIRLWIAFGYKLRLRHVVAYIGEGKYDDRFGDLVEDALDQSIISVQERDEIWNFHTTVLRGQIPKSDSTVFAVVDVALTIDGSHIERVAARAAILKRMVSEPVIPVLIGAFIDDNSLRHLADERGVSLFRSSLDDAKMYRYFGQDTLDSLYGGMVVL